MINHIRTLLLNLPADPTFGTPGEEFIPPAFTPRQLPAALRAARAVLFGTAPDRLGCNLRVRQLLAVVETSPLAEYLTYLDPRITYDVTADLKINHGVEVLGPAALAVQGQVDPVDHTGRCCWQYAVRVAGNTATLTRETLPRLETDVLVSYTAGRSPAFQLPGSSLLVYWSSTPAAEWQLHVTRPYNQSLGSVLATARQLSPAVLAEVFGGDRRSSTEPWASFLNAWHDDREGLTALGAFTVSLAYRIHREFYA